MLSYLNIDKIVKYGRFCRVIKVFRTWKFFFFFLSCVLHAPRFLSSLLYTVRLVYFLRFRPARDVMVWRWRIVRHPPSPKGNNGSSFVSWPSTIYLIYLKLLSICEGRDKNEGWKIRNKSGSGCSSLYPDRSGKRRRKIRQLKKAKNMSTWRKGLMSESAIYPERTRRPDVLLFHLLRQTYDPCNVSSLAWPLGLNLRNC
jgi:hypothetical protein